MPHVGIEGHLFVGGGGKSIVVGRDVRVGRADIILEAYAGKYGTADPGCQILGVEVGHEPIHLVVGPAERLLAVLRHAGKAARNMRLARKRDSFLVMFRSVSSAKITLYF